MTGAAAITADQVVAYNLARWRKAAKLTQEDLGQRTGWSAANVSALERSADPGHERRRFDAQMLITFAGALGVPLTALFLPPEDGGEGMAPLFARIMPESPEDSPAMDAYRQALAQAARKYLDRARADDLAALLDAMTDPGERQERIRKRIEDLHAFEREYRRRLRIWVAEIEAVLGPAGEDQ